MPTDLLSSKLFIPPLRPKLVSRPRLLHLLDEGLYTKRKLTLVSAPAGFGKTTLVLSWLKQINSSCAWVSLDEADNDLRSFLIYLVAALQLTDEAIGTPLLDTLQAPQLPAFEKVLTALLNEIAHRSDTIVLVLDDYQLLNKVEVIKVMEFLLYHQPPQLHIVLITREDPTLPLARLRSQDQITEIRARDLRFTREETGVFLRGVMGLEISKQDVAVLEERTEGWVVGLMLAGLSMQKQTDLTSFIAGLSGSHRYILDYLTDEVLQQQPESIRSFLLQTSILDRLSGPLCDALTLRTDSDEILAHLEAANLFVIPLDEERCSYRYYRLFSDLLRNQLVRSQPELIPELHQRASRYYEKNGEVDAAIEHALKAPDFTRAAYLIEQYAVPKLYEGEVTKVVGWYNRLPEEILASAPELCVGKAWALVLMKRGERRGEAERALHTANLALDRVGAGQALRDLVAGHAACIDAYLLQKPALIRKEPERLIAVSREAQRLLPLEEKAIRSTAALNIAYGYQALADLESARVAFDQALEDGISGGNYYAAIFGPVGLIYGSTLVGHLREALQYCEENIERFNTILAGKNFPPIGALYILKAGILLEFNRISEADKILAEGLDLVRWIGDSTTYKKGYTALARLRTIQNDRPAMLEAVKTLKETWSEGTLYAQSLSQRLSIRDKPKDPDVQLDAHSWLAQSGIEFDDLAAINSVDPINRSYFACCLNAAHVLARLAIGKPGIYQVEGVLAYLKRQHDLAASHGFVYWVVEIAIARTLLYKAAGKKHEALETLEVALRAAAPTGLLRIFLDEREPLQALVEEIKPRLTNKTLTKYANRLLESWNTETVQPKARDVHEAFFSEREFEVVRYLAKGLSYEEIGQQLFLSLNTIQFHVKNIYRKLSVNKRAQAIEKAREMNLI